MFTITIHLLDGGDGTQKQVAHVDVDGDDVRIHDPQGYLDLEVPAPAVDTLGRGERRRATFRDDPVVWAWNLPYLHRGPYLTAQLHEQSTPLAQR